VSSAVPGPQRWRRIDALFQAACDRSPAERAGFLDEACGGDDGLRAEIESLLASADVPLDFIRQPVMAAAQEVSGRSAMEGRRFGPYRILRAIGSGGMGTVYEACRADDAYSQNVAVKVMRADFGHDEAMRLRFRLERQILANLHHPNIAGLLDGGVTDEGLPWLALEYVEGVRIDAYCARECLTIRQVLELFRTVCAAIEYAHRNLVIHRDIKPANILVTAEGVPKVVDFGIAKLLDAGPADAARTRASERMMTPEYASPEQVRGESVTTATDVYALGTLLYELLAGKRPFSGGTTSAFEIARMICEQTPPAPSAGSAANPAVTRFHSRRPDRDLDTIVLMALRKEPERRYASAGQFSTDLEAYLNGYPLVARTATWSYRSATFIRRHKVAATGVALFAVALAGFVVAMGILAKRADQARQTAQRESEFLAGMFQAATPEKARGETVTARTLLDRGAARIDRELAGEPQAHASLLETIAEAYRSLGLFDDSLTLARRSLEVARKNLGPSSPEAATGTELLAELYRDKGEYAKAEPLLRGLIESKIASKTAASGATSPATARVMAELGECLYWEGKDAEARDVLEKTLAIDRKNGPDYGGDTRNYLALTLERSADFERAHQLLEESVEIRRRTLGASSPEYAISLNNLGSSLIDRGDLSGAEAKLREGLAIERRVLGAGHPDLVYPLNNLGNVLLQKGEWHAAEPFLKEALDINLARLGPNHPRLAGPMHNWARMLQLQGDYAQARRYFDRLVAIMRDARATETWPAAQIVASIGLLEFDQGNYAAAQQKARDAMEMRRRLGGEDTTAFADSLSEVAEARLYQKDARAAEPLLQQALQIRRKRFWSGHPATFTAEVRLGETILAEGDPARAEPLLREAWNSLKRVPFPVPAWQIADAQSVYGACLVRLGRKDEGDALLRDSRTPLKLHPRPALRVDAATRLSAF
jgi:serine/threonine-protein kinase